MARRFGGQKRSFGRRPFYKLQPNEELARQIRAVQLVGKKQNEQVGQVQEEYSAQNTFSNFGLSEKLLGNVSYKEYSTPTPIQDKVIPAVMQNRDVIGIANTGTGKTAAFLIPLIEKVFKNKSEKVLVLAPTRELALQIDEELKSFAKGLGVTSVLCIGGLSLGRQRMELRNHPNFIIATPGRLKELIDTRSVNMLEFRTVVLDEADRMVDIGFIQVIKHFISLLPRQRQSLFFSATISGKVAEILHAFVHDPVTVSVKTQETAENVQQKTIEVPREHKLDKLHDLLISSGFEKVLIFCRTKWGAQKLSVALISRGFKAEAIHGNKSQGQRQRALNKFKTDQTQILVATDVASRGLDIEDITHVINYDMPASYDDYVHRIGRTGRADKKGIALTFLEPKS